MSSSISAEKSPDSYGIPTTQPFLVALLKRVLTLLDGHDVNIGDIQHFQYQEAYLFVRSTEAVRVNLSYNSKGCVTAISAPIVNEFSDWLIGRLAPLKQEPIVFDRSECDLEGQFDKDFKMVLYRRLVELCEFSNIRIRDVEDMPWCQRYCFVRDDQQAIFDIWYNSKERFTKCQPLIPLCSKGALVSDVAVVITEGLSE